MKNDSISHSTSSGQARRDCAGGLDEEAAEFFAEFDRARALVPWTPPRRDDDGDDDDDDDDDDADDDWQTTIFW